MNRRFDHELSGALAASVRAIEDPSIPAEHLAQQRLDARLSAVARAPRARPRALWMAATATLAFAVLFMGTLPMLPGNGTAFAAVQARFRDFATLAMTVTQRFDGKPLQTSRIVVDARGVLRTDVGDQLSIIVDRPRGRVLTLLHTPREAVITPLPVRPADGQDEDPLAWLEALRTFKGQATALPGRRIIDGREARGWRLSMQGATFELWADADGLPLAMRQIDGGRLEIDYRFAFDTPLPPGHLDSDPPPGYALVASGGD